MFIAPAHAHGLLGGEAGAHDGPLILLTVLVVVVSLLVAGPRQPPAVHALVDLLNHALGNVGNTVHFTADPDEVRPSHVDAIRELAHAYATADAAQLCRLGAVLSMAWFR